MSTILEDIEAIDELAAEMEAPPLACPWCRPDEPCWWHRAWRATTEEAIA